MYIGIDTGGTFTDFVCWSNGQAFTLKVPSTPSNPADAVLDGLRQLLARAQLSGSAREAAAELHGFVDGLREVRMQGSGAMEARLVRQA